MDGSVSERENHVWADGRPVKRITLRELLEHAPGLQDLLDEARRLRDTYGRGQSRSARRLLLTREFGGRRSIRSRLGQAVGFYCDNPQPWVRTAGAYEVALRALVAEAMG